MRLLITGGAGFIGSNFVGTLFESSDVDFEITVLDSLTYAGNIQYLEPYLSNGQIRFVKGDIRNEETVNKCVQEVEFVVHFAAETHVDRSILNSSDFITTNILGTHNLLEASRKYGIKKFIQISTDEVYGSISGGSWDENSPLKPNSPYSSSKASGDLMALSYFTTYGLPVVVTRSSNNYGPKQNEEKLIPKVISNSLKDINTGVYGSGNNVRDWLHVRDNCQGILAVLLNGMSGEVYNLGGSNELTNLEVVNLILDLLGKPKSLISKVEDRLGHDFRYSVNSEKARSVGFKPIRDFHAGLSETIEWYKSHANVA
jgi:dTDP-glucose 4,6-dehydratase